MSATSRYITDLCYKVIEASRECDPYDFDADSAWMQTMDAIMEGKVKDIINYFNEQIEELTEKEKKDLYPATTAVLPLLIAYESGQLPF